MSNAVDDDAYADEDDAAATHLVPVYEYRAQAIAEAVRWAKRQAKPAQGANSGTRAAYWERAWRKERHYFVDTRSNVVYELRTRYSKTAFLEPIDSARVTQHGLTLLEGHRLDWRAPLLCQCGNDRLEIRRTGSYETSGRCPECGATDVVHDG